MFDYTYVILDIFIGRLIFLLEHKAGLVDVNFESVWWLACAVIPEHQNNCACADQAQNFEGEATSRVISDNDSREFCHEDAHRGQFDGQNAFNGYHILRCYTRDEMTKTWPLGMLNCWSSWTWPTTSVINHLNTVSLSASTTIFRVKHSRRENHVDRMSQGLSENVQHIS